MSKTNIDKAPVHIPVMVQEVISYLSPARGDDYLDLTAGYGGHASAVASLVELDTVTLVDRDEKAVEALSKLGGAKIIHADFLSASRMLATDGKTYNMILADLGASSLHLDEAGRGFSFSRSGPLDMRMDQRQADTAADLVNHASQAELARLLADYGQEARAGKIARAIVTSRPITSTGQLADIVQSAVPRFLARKKKIHPATKTFQALRIAVNDELNQLEQSLPLWERLLAPGGRLVVISFHSLEDRAVKQYFAQNAGDRYDCELRLLTKKPVVASKDETVSNPRARSAKLRAVAKIKTKKGSA